MTVAVSPGPTQRDEFYIGGRWVAPSSTQRIDVGNPATEAILGSVPEGTEHDVAKAVDAARLALDQWSITSPTDRADWMTRIATGLSERAEEISRLIAAEVGTPLAAARRIQTALAIADWNIMAEAVASVEWEQTVGNSLVLREPVGVVAAITPWNYPLHQISAKAAGALAAGCTVVVKPSEVAPLSAFLLADILSDLGLPPGVFNLVSGFGPTVGEALVRHAGVDMVSFTGSARAGRRISRLAADGLKPVALELGGKSAAIILSDADLPAAITGTIAKCYQNTGQTCTALTRMLVPCEVLSEAERIAAEIALGYQPGNPFDEDVRLGPIATAEQLARVQSYIRLGIEEGAKLICGGERPAGLDAGHFIAPTVFSSVTPDMRVAQEEIFGPVLTILTYQDESDAVRIANESPYGLSGAVWSADTDHAIAVARRLRTGQVTINDGAFNPRAPFGGVKDSGYGREFGSFGLEEFLTYKALQT